MKLEAIGAKAKQNLKDLLHYSRKAKYPSPGNPREEREKKLRLQEKREKLTNSCDLKSSIRARSE